MYETQLKSIKNHKEDNQCFSLNLAKGFIYLMNKLNLDAYKYLSTAININNSIDLTYALRAFIGSEVNPDFEEDAKTAVLLNPSARNYFVLASIDIKRKDIDLKRSLIYFDRAIKLHPDFACAYNNKAFVCQKLKDLEKAIESYKKCIEIDPMHWAYYQLWLCLDEKKRYDEALKYALLGHAKHPEDIKYHFCLGVANARLKKNEEAILHYQNYLTVKPDSKVANRNMEICQIKIYNRWLREAINRFHSAEYTAAVELFEKYLAKKHHLFEEDLDAYLISLLKKNNQDVVIGEENPIYKRLNTLKALSNQLNVTENSIQRKDNVDKIMEYRSGYTINFGKHEGEKLTPIMEDDPHYILWCIINLDHFSISNILFLSQELKKEPDYLLALEHNLIKKIIIEEWIVEDDIDDISTWTKKSSIRSYPVIEHEYYDDGDIEYTYSYYKNLFDGLIDED